MTNGKTIVDAHVIKQKMCRDAKKSKIWKWNCECFGENGKSKIEKQIKNEYQEKKG